MGKLFGKKGAEGDEDSKRSALFGGRSKKDKSESQSQNPYANLPSQSDAYTQAKSRAGIPGYAQPSADSSGPPSYKGNSSGYPDEKKAGGYGADKYGAQGGYGADRYGSGSQPSQSSRGPGGYGGLGPAPQDDNRDALFGNAQQRVQKQQQQQMGYGQPPPYEEGGDSGYGAPPKPDYEAYGDRQLTAEEEEEEDVTATKQQMRFIKQEDVSSTRNALRLAAQAEEQGVTTLARIGAQGERIHNTEKNLDLTANHNRLAEEKAKELKHLNRSMFAVSVSNPFTSGKRAEQRDADVLEKHRLEREMREQTRRAEHSTDQRMQKTFKDLSKEDPNSAARKQAGLAERSRFQFEADSEDEEMENEVSQVPFIRETRRLTVHVQIDSNLTALHGAAGRLNNVARAVGKEVDEQNRHLERINAKVCTRSSF